MEHLALEFFINFTSFECLMYLVVLTLGYKFKETLLIGLIWVKYYVCQEYSNNFVK